MKNRFIQYRLARQGTTTNLMNDTVVSKSNVSGKNTNQPTCNYSDDYYGDQVCTSCASSV